MGSSWNLPNSLTLQLYPPHLFFSLSLQSGLHMHSSWLAKGLRGAFVKIWGFLLLWHLISRIPLSISAPWQSIPNTVLRLRLMVLGLPAWIPSMFGHGVWGISGRQNQYKRVTHQTWFSSFKDQIPSNFFIWYLQIVEFIYFFSFCSEIIMS